MEDELDGDRLAAAWRQAGLALHDGWTVDSLRCASTGLAPTQRSDQWRAVATGPANQTMEGRGAGPEEALANLVAHVVSHKVEPQHAP